MLAIEYKSDSPQYGATEGSTRGNHGSVSNESPSTPPTDTSFDRSSASASYFDQREPSRSSTPSTPESIRQDDSSVVADNSLPDHPYFQTDYQKTLEESRMLCWLIEDRLRAAKDRNLDPLAKIAHDISAIDHRVTRKIAVLGDSGVGKSTLLNCLLDCDDIAQQGGSGVAVTSVPTEYRYLEGKSSGFCLEVEYQTKEEIQATIREYVWNVQCLDLPDMNEKDVSAEEYQARERNMKIADDALKVIFADRAELKEVCTRHNEDSYEYAVSTLIQWSDDLVWPDGSEDGRLHYNTNDADDCADRLADFTSGNLWPLLKIARIYLKSRLLEHGIVLVDLPGLRDTNAARVKATQEHLAKVHHVLILANIIRAGSNESINEAVFGTMRRNFPNTWNKGDANYRGLTIVCTKSEDMVFKEMEKEFVRKRKLLDKKKVDDLLKKVNQAAKMREDNRFDTDLRHVFMDARNKFVISTIQQAYKSENDSKGLNIFCVSSKEYSAGREYNDSARIIKSQIPALREHCLWIAVEHQFAEAQKFLMDALPGLLQSINLYTTPQSKADRSLLDGLSALEKRFSTFQDEMESEFGITEVLADCLTSLRKYSKRRVRDWAGSASTVHDRYMKWHWASYRAFVRHNGTHTTAAVGHVRWNDQMSAHMRDELSSHWDALATLTEDQVDNLSESMQDKLKRLAGNEKKMANFSKVVRLLIPYIESELEKIEGVATSRIRFIQSKVDEDNRASFMYSAMFPIYREAAGIIGRGSATTQREYVSSNINQDLFAGIYGDIVDELRLTLSGLDSNLRELQAFCIQKLEDDLEAVRRSLGKNSIEAPAKDYSAIRRSLKDWLNQSEKGVTMAKEFEQQTKVTKVLPIR